MSIRTEAFTSADAVADELEALIEEARRRARRRRLGCLALLAAVGVFVAGFYLGASGTGGDGSAHHGPPAGRPSGEGGGGASARLKGSAVLQSSADLQVPFSPEILRPRNAWFWNAKGGSGVGIFVYAGRSGHHSADGLFMILRNRPSGAQKIDSVRVEGSDAVVITNPPVGPLTAKRAERTSFGFRSNNGTKGTLHLADDSLTITHVRKG